MLACLLPELARAEARVIGDVSNLVPASLALSPDGRRFAVVIEDPNTKLRAVAVNEERLGKWYDQIAAANPIFSPDGRRVAFVAKKGDKCYVIAHGFESPAYDIAGTAKAWPIADLMFSPNSKHLAYKAHLQGKTVLVVNGDNVGAYDDALLPGGKLSWGVWGLTFSQDGEFFAYRAKIGDKMVACAGRCTPEPPGSAGVPPAPAGKMPALQKPGNRVVSTPEYAAIGIGTPIPVPGHGQQVFAFIANDFGTELVSLLNGPKWDSPKYDRIQRGSLVCAPYDPKALDYVAVKNGRCVAVIGGKEGPPYDNIVSIMYSPDGKRWAYAAQKGKSAIMVVNGKEEQTFTRIRCPPTLFSPDSQRVAYMARWAMGCTVVLDGKPGDNYEYIDPSSVAFSADSKHLGYIVGEPNAQMAVVDGKKGPRFTGKVSGFQFAPGGARYAYWARQGVQAQLVVDGETLGPFDDLAPNSPVFSPDGKRIAYAALKSGKWQVYVDGEAGPVCEELVSRIAFSPDSEDVAYVAKVFDEGRPVFTMICNNQPGKSYDSVWMGDGGKLFYSDGAFTCMGKRGPLVYRETTAVSTVEPHLFLSDMKYVKGTVGWGEVPKMDRNIKGSPLMVMGRQFAKGIGAHALSEIVYDLPPLLEEAKAKARLPAPKAKQAPKRGKPRKEQDKEKPGPRFRFVALAAVDDETQEQASVQFQVYADETLLAQSPVLRRGGVHRFDIGLPPAAKQLRLIANDGGDGPAHDWADWINAGIVFDGE